MSPYLANRPTILCETCTSLIDENGIRRTLRRNNCLFTTTSESVIRYVNAFLRTTPINTPRRPIPINAKAPRLRREPTDGDGNWRAKLTT
jgi:hypothetical protein